MSAAASIDSIAARLRSADPRERIDALLLLQSDPDRIRDDRVVDALMDNLASPIKRVQRHAAAAAAAGASHIDGLRQRLYIALQSRQAALRWAAAYTLGLIDGALDARACPALIEALDSNDGDVRWAALELLIRLAQRSRALVRDRLLQALRAGAVNSRKMALYGLRDLGARDPDAIAAACAACASADLEVRLAGLALLKQTGTGNPDVVDAVLACLQTDPEQGVRRAAAFTLGFLGDRSQRVLAALRGALQCADDPSLQKAARRTMDRLTETT